MDKPSYEEFTDSMKTLLNRVPLRNYSSLDEYIVALTKIGFSLNSPFSKDVVISLLSTTLLAKLSASAYADQLHKILGLEVAARATYEEDYETLVRYMQIQDERLNLYADAQSIRVRNLSDDLVKGAYKPATKVTQEEEVTQVVTQDVTQEVTQVTKDSGEVG